jgi:ATP-dependent Clp protease ATP-binding subunit ClpC
MQDDLVAQIVRHADGDPAAIAAQIEDEAERGGRTDVAPSLSPAAKAALLRAYDEMRALNSSYLGPEHVLLALARDTESDAGRLLARFGLSHTALRAAVIRGVTLTDEGGRRASQTKTLDEYSRDLTEAARQGKLDPVIGRADEIEETIEILSRRTKNNPVLIGDPAWERRRSRRASPSGSSTMRCLKRSRASGWWCSTWPAWSPARSTAASSRTASSR